MEIDEVLKLIKHNEDEEVEYKPSLSQINEIVETVSAFSNAEGGKIIVGVNNSGDIIGIDVGKDTVERLTNKISQNTDPKVYPRILIKETGGKNIIIISIKPSLDKLVLAFGRPYKRIGKSTRKMSKDEYERMILEKHKDKLCFDARICEGAKLVDINMDKILWFIKEAKKQRGLDIEEGLPIMEILERLRLVRDSKITNAAILLFGKNPQKFFLQAIIKAIRFKGNDVTEDMIDFKTIEADILTQLEKAEDFIFEHIPKSAWIEEGKLQRQEKWLYPPKAIREALSNALSHRDYETPSNVQIRIFDDRLEIWNPGCLPPGLTVEKLKTKHNSIPRNPLIARAFFWVKYVEEVGTGTNKMIRWCKEWELPEPNYEETGTSFVLTFRRYYISDDMLEKLNERQKRAMDYLLKSKKITNKEYRDVNPNISDRTALIDLKDLVEKGIIVSKGTKRYRYYVLR